MVYIGHVVYMVYIYIYIYWYIYIYIYIYGSVRLISPCFTTNVRTGKKFIICTYSNQYVPIWGQCLLKQGEEVHAQDYSHELSQVIGSHSRSCLVQVLWPQRPGWRHPPISLGPYGNLPQISQGVLTWYMFNLFCIVTYSYGARSIGICRIKWACVENLRKKQIQMCAQVWPPSAQKWGFELEPLISRAILTYTDRVGSKPPPRSEVWAEADQLEKKCPARRANTQNLISAMWQIRFRGYWFLNFFCQIT